MAKRLLAVLVALGAMLTNPAEAALTPYADRDAWRNDAAGRDVLFEDFDSFVEDTFYGLGAPVVAGFLSLSKAPGLNDTSFLIDHFVSPGDEFLGAVVPAVNGTTFATTVAAGGLRTVITFPPVIAFGFDYGTSSAGGEILLETSAGEVTSFSNASGGGFFGMVSGVPFTSLTWSSTTGVRFAGIDNVEAVTPIPLPGTLALLLSAIAAVVMRRAYR